MAHWYVAFPYPVIPPASLEAAFLQWIASIAIGGATVAQREPAVAVQGEPGLVLPAPDLAAVPPAARQVVTTIENIAQRYGIDPLLALATAIHESGLNPRAIGDGGTSFGLFQLHQGGELGDLAPDQAFDPTLNADVALSTFQQFGPASNYATPGAFAAAAQRPADPVGYAQAVDSLYQQLRAGTLPLAG